MVYSGNIMADLEDKWQEAMEIEAAARETALDDEWDYLGTHGLAKKAHEWLFAVEYIVSLDGRFSEAIEEIDRLWDEKEKEEERR